MRCHLDHHGRRFRLAYAEPIAAHLKLNRIAQRSDANHLHGSAARETHLQKAMPYAAALRDSYHATVLTRRKLRQVAMGLCIVEKRDHVKHTCDHSARANTACDRRYDPETDLIETHSQLNIAREATTVNHPIPAQSRSLHVILKFAWARFGRYLLTDKRLAHHGPRQRSTE